MGTIPFPATPAETPLAVPAKQEEIARSESLSPRAFHRTFARRGQPVLFPGGARDWRAMSRWSFPWLRQHYGEVRIPVKFGKRDGGVPWSLGDFIDSIFADPEAAGHVKNIQYLQHLPALAADLDFPAYNWLDRLSHKGLWLAPAGKISPPHCDFVHNLNVQIAGRKRFQLAPPGAISHRHNKDRNWRAAFTRATFAEPSAPAVLPGGDAPVVEPKYDLVLDPGDILFIPYGWWHRVTNIEPSISVTLFWYTPMMLLASLLGRVAPRSSDLPRRMVLAHLGQAAT